MKIIDLSMNNIGEALYKDGKYVGAKMHDFDWQKSIDQGVEGAIIKCMQGTAKDPAFDILMSSCPFDVFGPYGYSVWTQKAYPLGGEVAWGKKQGQQLLEAAYKYEYTTRVAVDFEQNRNWEKLDNTPFSGFALNRALKIVLNMVVEIERLAGYWPLMYTNPWLTRSMHNFTMCPLWISDPTTEKPTFYTWTEYAMHQWTWKLPGFSYGNYIGNSAVDGNDCPDVSKILIPGGTTVTEDEPCYAIVIAWLGVMVRVQPGTEYASVGKLARGEKKQVLERARDKYGNPWVKISNGWICENFAGKQLLEIA